MNWYKLLKQADQFTDFLSPEEATEFSHMNDTIVLYQKANEDIYEKGRRRGFIDEEKRDIQNNQFMIDKVQEKIRDFKEWVKKNRNKRQEYSILNEAKKHFGITEDPNEAGYILPDGTMLDFSGRHAGGRYGGVRSVDHRAVSSLLGQEGLKMTEGMNAFMRLTGSIRVGSYNDYLFISFKAPVSEQQASKIIELGKGMRRIDMEGIVQDDFRKLEFPNGTQIRKTINELV